MNLIIIFGVVVVIAIVVALAMKKKTYTVEKDVNRLSGMIAGGPKSNGSKYKYLGDVSSAEQCGDVAKDDSFCKSYTYHTGSFFPEWANGCYCASNLGNTPAKQAGVDSGRIV